jgi:O-antigen/teichoic acid export membrane protein
MHSLTAVTMLQSQIAPLLAAGRKTNKSEFHSLEHRLQIEIGAWALLLSAGIAVVTPLLLPFLGRPLLRENLAIFWVILAATLLRVAADAYGYALLALNRDSEIAAIAVAGALASAALNSVLTPVAGLWGAAMTYTMIAGGLFAIRFYVTRQQVYSGLPIK